MKLFLVNNSGFTTSRTTRGSFAVALRDVNEAGKYKWVAYSSWISGPSWSPSMLHGIHQIHFSPLGS
jgi:hypothetical protein